ncbi:MAG: ABC transporter permease [Longimicrobiales bacterium]
MQPGIRPDHLLTMYIGLPSSRYDSSAVPRFYNELEQRTRNTPGVLNAAVTSIVPFSGDWDRITVDTGSARIAEIQNPEGDRYIVSATYFQTMGIPLLRGRTFDDSDRSGPPVAVVDEVFARKVARNGTALGVPIGAPGRDTAATIIGIVGHVKHYGLDAESVGQICATVALPALRREPARPYGDAERGRVPHRGCGACCVAARSTRRCGGPAGDPEWDLVSRPGRVTS